jgi:hypothetical protein
VRAAIAALGGSAGNQDRAFRSQASALVRDSSRRDLARAEGAVGEIPGGPEVISKRPRPLLNLAVASLVPESSRERTHQRPPSTND